MSNRGYPVYTKIRYIEFAVAVGEGELVSRADMAARMGVTMTSATYNLENAVSQGLLAKTWGIADNVRPGWVYGWPATIEALENDVENFLNLGDSADV